MKNKNKLILLILLLLLCSGCTVKYNIEITVDKVKEKIEINDTVTSKRTKKNIYDDFNIWYPTYFDALENTTVEYDFYNKIENVEYHTKNINELNDGYNIEYEYIYPIEKYQNASSIRQAYSKRNFYISNENISINTNNINMLCDYENFKELIVNIKVDKNSYTVEYNNATEVKDNQYIWKLNKTNCDESSILLSLNKNILEKNTVKKESEYIIYIVYAVIILIVILISLYIKKIKNKDNNNDI